MFQGLPGIGPARDRRLVDSFGSVEAVLTANRDELRAVEGIGPTSAGSIRWVVSEDSDRELRDDEPTV